MFHFHFPAIQYNETSGGKSRAISIAGFNANGFAAQDNPLIAMSAGQLGHFEYLLTPSAAHCAPNPVLRRSFVCWLGQALRGRTRGIRIDSRQRDFT
jgi:hypothetical protein